MNILEIIENKKDKKELTKEQIDFFINKYTQKEIPDYQASALLMAICLNGMTDEETVNLTNAMVNTGDILDYGFEDKILVDKHSTGGVGDKTSLVLIPLLASMGFVVPKLSGRGLGYTGGTIDKLESIEGFSANISEEALKEELASVGCAIIESNKKLVPADGLLYALRDVTATVSSIPLIASSIMSKKIALGSDIIVLDVKYGSGAFIQKKAEAKKLAKLMVTIGNSMGKKTVGTLTNMDQPLGQNVGNALEVKEAIDVLQGENDSELKELVVILAEQFLEASDLDTKGKSNKEFILEKLENGSAYNKFLELIKAQGFTGTEVKLKEAEHVYELIAPEFGCVHRVDALEIAKAVLLLGGGRQEKGDEIDHAVGIELLKKVGDYVQEKDVLARIHYNDARFEEAFRHLTMAYVVDDKKCQQISLLDEIIK